MTKYSYEKLCDPGRITQEILASAIVTALDHIETVSSPEGTDIWFKAELSSGDEDILDALVAAHVNEPLPDDVPLVQIDQPKDSDGSPLSRSKITQSGWTMQLHGLEFETAKLGSFYSKNHDASPAGVDFGFGSMKFFKDNGAGGLAECADQAEADTSCIATQVDWEPTHDYEILGGALKQLQPPAQDIRCWVIGVPDIPAGSGGNKPFVVSMNLRYLDGSGITVDGKTPKYLSFNAAYHTNRIRLFFRHPAGVKHPMMMVFQIFKA
jgi:hypothetical protein